MMGFDEYWSSKWHPSGMPAVFDLAMKELAENAWRAALVDAANKFDGTTGYNWTAADGYANACDIASELRYMAIETPNVQAQGRADSGPSSGA